MILTDTGPLVAILSRQVFTLDRADFRTYRAHGRRVFDLIPA